MRVLIACEFSGIVRDEFKKRGHFAVSCDLLPTEKGMSHYHGDIFDILNDRWKLRSTTYLGIAEAMAEQWGSA